LAARCDVLTTEIEHVDVDALDRLTAAVDTVSADDATTPAVQRPPPRIEPSPATIRVIQDKLLQKQHLRDATAATAAGALPLPDFAEVDPVDAVGSVRRIAEAGPNPFGYPCVLKARKLAYDGRGNRVVCSSDDVPAAVAALAPPATTANSAAPQPLLYLERFVPFERELAVMVARDRASALASYPCVETVQRDNVCRLVVAPAQVNGAIAERACRVAEAAVAALPPGAGVYGVELFLLADGAILVNEIAPRPHNSGHYTIEACCTSQFEQHLRAVLGLPLGSPDLKVGAAVMINLLGRAPDPRAADELADPMRCITRPCEVALKVPGATVHLYGKSDCRPGRKMGHITVVADSASEALARALPIIDALDPPSDDDAAAGSTSGGGSIPPLVLHPSAAAARLAARHPADAAALAPRPVVAIIMGSDSDLPKMRPAAAMLRRLAVPFELTVVSAHRTPDRLVAYARAARARGLRVIIAAAGGAAHLPGMVAALSPLPVIGVPIALSHLDGVDSLHSIVQMP
ncbi:phosphoribosylaminoimidazole carboxylase ade2, partial [Cladochytrium tenue]